MKIIGLGFPELLVLLIPILVIAVIVALVVALVITLSRKPKKKDAYQELIQLDDLRKRGAISEEEYQQHKNDALRNL